MVSGRQVAIIPARGGSKRIEKKNILEFHGKPMLAWTVEAALQAGLFDRIVVSTDDPEVAEIARRHGASVPFLRTNHADDQSPASLATIESLRQLRDELGEEFEVVAQLMPTCPLRNARHIIEAMDHFRSRAAKSQISCCKFGWMNPWWAATLSPEGRPTPLFADAMRARSQDLPELYCPTGAIWVAQVEHLRAHQTFHAPDSVYWPMPWEASIDIDTREDLRMAELFHTMTRSGR